MLKISLLIIGMISLIFILTSGISIQFKPFHISLAYPYFGTGMVLIAIGFALCFGSAYYHGISNHEFKDGFSKGFNAGIDTLWNGHRIKKKAKGYIFIARDKD